MFCANQNNIDASYKFNEDHPTLESEPNFAAIRFLQRVLSVFPAPSTTILSTDALIRAIAVLLIGWVKSLRW